MLYLISTPIGNLGDISYRAIETLKKCDYILCEDTRHSKRLLDHYEIHKPLRSFHSFNEALSQEKILQDLKEGKVIALISDAGTPLISDPGHDLVLQCKKEEIPISAIPGACAFVDALLLSGYPTSVFQFIGFLPKKEQELKMTLAQALLYEGTTICYESPHRIEETLHTFLIIAPNRQLCIARELTKLHEECLFGTAEELCGHFHQNPPRGEMVLLVYPPAQKILYADLSLQELVAMLQQEMQLSKTEAIKMAAQFHALPKRAVYKEFI